MISRRKLPELRAFARAEAKLPFRADREYGALVVPNGNDGLPVHGWFKYKEAFSADLLSYLLKHSELRLARASQMSLLDPFCGVGTSLVSSQLLADSPFAVSAAGIECNPFSAFVARTKVSWSQANPARVRQLAACVLSRPPDAEGYSLPDLSSIRTGRCIAKRVAGEIVSIRERLVSLAPSIECDVLMVGLASCIEVVSKVRRDGRALRLVKKPRTNLQQLLAARWEMMARDIEALRQSHRKVGIAKVFLGDGRALAEVPARTVDLILTSPPYPNNIDYNEIYKLELWLLGFVDDAGEFLELRKATYRSHPTCRVVDAVAEPHDKEFARVIANGLLSELLGIVIRRAASLDREHGRGRSKVLLGYVYDTWRSLKAHYGVLKRGARAVYVVGNSLHGGIERPYLVPTDLILACLGQEVGFSVEHLIVARPLQRRLAGNHFLRDSLLVLRKN